jgi:hypothetical protein
MMPNLMSHTLVVLFGVFLILFVISLTNNIRNDYRDFIVENEIDHVCMLVKGAIAKIYVSDNIPGRYNDTLGSITVRMPERIGETNYRASFFNSSIRVETFFDIQRNVTCVAGFPAAYTGSTTGGLTSITLYQYINGTKVIEMKNI